MDNSVIVVMWRKIFKRLEDKNKFSLELINDWRLRIFSVQEPPMTSIFDKVIRDFRIIERRMEKIYEKERQKIKGYQF